MGLSLNGLHLCSDMGWSPSLPKKKEKALNQNFVNKKEILPNEVIFLICFKFIYHWSSSHVLQTSRADYYRWPNALIIMDFQWSRNVLVGCQKIQKRDNANRKSDVHEQYSYFLLMIFVVIPIPLLNLGVSTTFFRIMTLNHKDLIYKTYQKRMIDNFFLQIKCLKT